MDAIVIPALRFWLQLGQSCCGGELSNQADYQTVHKSKSYKLSLILHCGVRDLKVINFL